jgi:hypothetical protein
MQLVSHLPKNAPWHIHGIWAQDFDEWTAQTLVVIGWVPFDVGPAGFGLNLPAGFPHNLT